MKITALYITKNEEKNIEKSIISCKDFFDDLIVIDTGSTDNTVSIAKSLGATVYDSEWKNDFALARNYAISKATGDYILFLDADEYFSPALTVDHKNAVKNYLINNPSTDGLGFSMLNLDKDTGKKLHTSFSSVFFRNDKHIYYRFPIHEALFRDNGELNMVYVEFMETPFNLIHTGYGATTNEEKSNRNLSILNKIENKTAKDYFYIGRENLSIGKTEEAFNSLKNFFNSEDHLEWIEWSDIGYLAYFYYYDCLNVLDATISEKEEWLRKMKRDIPEVPEVYYLLGNFWYNKDLDKSYKYFLKCIKINEEFSKKTSLNNFKGYEPTLYLKMAQIQELLGNRTKSFNHAMVAVILDKTSFKTFSYFLHLLKRGNVEHNLGLILKIMQPKTQKDYEFIMGALSYTDLTTEFVYFANEYNTKHGGGNLLFTYAMMVSGAPQKALDFLSKINSLEAEVCKIVSMFYADSPCFISNNKVKLTPDGLIVYNHILNSKDTTSLSSSQLELFNNVFLWLNILGFSEFNPTLVSTFIQNAPERDILTLLSVLKNNSDYKNYLIYSALLEKEENIQYINHYISALYYNKKYDEMVDYIYNKISTKNYGVYTMLLKLCPNTISTKSLKQKKQIERIIKYEKK